VTDRHRYRLQARTDSPCRDALCRRMNHDRGNEFIASVAKDRDVRLGRGALVRSERRCAHGNAVLGHKRTPFGFRCGRVASGKGRREVRG
jgi:hypothetical protein